jgi:hypothetical protein
MTVRSVTIAIALITWLFLPSSAYSQPGKLDKTAAGKLLVQKVENDSLYASWTTIQCLRFILEGSTSLHFDFAIRERHDGKCPGDPAVDPIVDRFRIDRGTGRILWYDPDGNYVPYARVKQSRTK